MKVTPGKIVRRVDETGRPILLTSHGRGVAVVQALADYEAAQEERDFMRAVVAGLADIDAGRVSSRPSWSASVNSLCSRIAARSCPSSIPSGFANSRCPRIGSSIAVTSLS